MEQLALKVCPDGPKWAHLVPLLPTLDALLRSLDALFGDLVHLFTHFYAFL